jgi:hypothetical protein
MEFEGRPAIELKFERVFCPMHGEPFRKEWPATVVSVHRNGTAFDQSQRSDHAKYRTSASRGNAAARLDS